MDKKRKDYPAFSESELEQTLSVIRDFAEREQLDHLTEDPQTLDDWCRRWLASGWTDEDGKDLNQGVIYRQGGTRRLLPRWASMLLGYEQGYRRKAKEDE